MLIADAHVATERPSRYLVQLCEHVTLIADRHPEMSAHVEWSDDHGLIRLGSGHCTLRAEPGVLSLRAEAPDEEASYQIEQRIGGRLEQVGRRDGLTVSWGRARASSSG